MSPLATRSTNDWPTKAIHLAKVGVELGGEGPAPGLPHPRHDLGEQPQPGGGLPGPDPQLQQTHAARPHALLQLGQQPVVLRQLLPGARHGDYIPTLLKSVCP